MRDKKGQIAMWVILAIGIFILIIVFYYLLNQARKPSIDLGDDVGVQDYIQRCLRENARDAVEVMSPQGGFIEPSNYKIYNDTKIEYLCKNTGNYRPCINQHPMFLNDLKKEIKDYLDPKVEECLASLEEDLASRQSKLERGDFEINVDLAPERIFIDLVVDLSVSKNGQTSSYDKFETELVNPLYNLALIGMEIANQEAKYCYFEYVGYMILYPRFSIEKFAMSDSTKIYTIIDKKSKQELNIATRSCAIPPGI